MREEEVKELIKKILQEAQATTSPAKEYGVFETVEEAIHAAKFAQECYENQTLETRRKVIAAIRCGMQPHIEKIARDTLEETGMGRYEDKIQKLQLAIDKTPGVEDLRTEALTGDNGMTLYELSPYGVVGAVTPSTNPAETVICNAIGMLTAGNAVYFSVHPGAKKISSWVVSKMNELVYEVKCKDIFQ